MSPSKDIKKIQVQGLNHVTFVGADRQSTVDFWEGVLGMPCILEQRNPQKPYQGQIYFDPGDGRFITVFTDEGRSPKVNPAPPEPGEVHHVAFTVSRATFSQITHRLKARGVDHSPPRNRGFMETIYFRDPMGFLIELACYTFAPPAGYSHADVLLEAHRIQLAQRDTMIRSGHLADAIERLVARGHGSAMPGRGPCNPY